MRLLQPLTLAILLGASASNASLADDIVNAIKNAASCASCHALFVPLKGLALLGDTAFSATFVAVCKALGTIDADVCEGAVGMQGPIIAQDLRSINPLGHTAEKLCDALLGLCQPPAVNSHRVPFPKPAPANPKTFVSTGKPPFQVVHFSDVHIDRQYTVGADSTCTKPICCRVYADKVGPVSTPAGPFGSRNCDTPAALAQNLLKTIGANNKFSIFTGDLVEASVWLVDRGAVTKDIDLFTSELSGLPKVTVYPALGNHESAPANAFPRNTTTKASSQWVFDTLSKGWAPIIGQAAAQQAASLSGSYSSLVPGTNLKIISINNIFWYKANFWLYDSDTLQPDPNGILEFAVRELQAAEDAGQRVWIIAHMAPNRQDTLRDQSNHFDQVVQRYKNVIAGQFYGHSHMDQFALSYSNYKNQTAENAVSVGWIAPAITPRSNDPGFKVYDVDPDTYEIMDAKIYRSALSDPTFNVNPQWNLVYSARQTYGPLVPQHPATEALTPAFWHRVTEGFERNQTAFETYLRLKTGSADVPACDANCKKVSICEVRSLRAENSCGVSTPGLNFKRDGDIIEEDHHGHIQTDTCQGVGLHHVLHGIADNKDIDWEELGQVIQGIVAQGESAGDGAQDI